MKRLIGLIVCFFVLFSNSSISFSIEPNYILQIFNSGDYPVLISDNHNVLFENFTATWCGWCHYSYEIFDTLREKFGKQIINIRYHNQDELMMDNVTDRSGYYKVNGYPTMVFNGNIKMVGADSTTYPEVEKVVTALLEKPAKLGVYSTGYLDGNLIRITSIIQSFSEEPVTGNFLTVFTESNVQDKKERKYDYVSRSVFPSFQGLKLTIECGKIYIVKYSKAVAENQKSIDFEAVSFFQNQDTREIYNSCSFMMDSLIVSRLEPTLFTEDVKRDSPFVLEFQEGLVLGSIESAEMMIVSNHGEMIFFDPVYDRIKKTLTLYPLKLLNPETGYFVLIVGGNRSLLSVNKKRLNNDIIIPFHTSKSPELNLDISDQAIDFGDIYDIDLPEKVLQLKEQNGVPMRFKFKTSSKWIESSEILAYGSDINLKIKINTTQMRPGINKGVLTIVTVLGNITIPIQANLISNGYPQIRFFNYYPYTFSQSVEIFGRTNGYRLFVGTKEIEVDDQGYFKIQLTLVPEYNFFMIQVKNMQQKITNQIIMIYRFAT
jgi:thiol-disulfide isomerase/thioredoxin